MSSGLSSSASTRAGFVAIIGLPNAGKSTLLNEVVGEHLSIATPKAQTTWQRVTGIVTDSSSQLVFLDTPGVLEPRDMLHRSMREAAKEALAEADVVLLVLDSSMESTKRDQELLSQVVAGARAPVHVAINKVDRASPPVLQVWEAWTDRLPNARRHRISALTGEGLSELLVALRNDLPVSPFLFPDDEIAVAPVRFFVAELVRETIFELYHQEIPYSVFCEVSEFREGQDPVYVGVEIYVERPSQKGILIGKGGDAIRRLGTASRIKIEHLIGRAVYLDLWVKPLESWRKSRAHLSRFGFSPPVDHEGSR